MNSKHDRMPPLALESLDALQRAAADALIAGPRKAVKGPFIALLRSPQLLAPLQAAGEYLRFGSALPRRVSEFATLVVARQWSQQFEWQVHVPLARQAGTGADTLEGLRQGLRPATMSAEEAFVHDFVVELTTRRGVADATYAEAIQRFGERGVVDLVGLIGYFTLMSMVLNVAGTPAGDTPDVASLPPPAS